MNKGFTIIELLVSVAIIGVVAVLLISGFNSFRESTQLNEAHSNILGILRDARSRTLSGEKNTHYSVHFEENQVVLFSGSLYVSGFSSNEVYSLPSLTRISSISLGGPTEVIFARLTGSASASGTITIQSTSNSSKTKTIIITSSGSIE